MPAFLFYLNFELLPHNMLANNNKANVAMDVLQKITQAIEPSLESMGYTLVQIKLADTARRKTLSIMAERIDEQGMSFDDCTEISRMVSALLDVEDPISGAYDLEVCSPGLDRPLVKQKDYKRYKGFEAKLETMFPVQGRKRFRGTIEGVNGEDIKIAMPEGQVSIPFSSIRTAKLVANDALVSAAMKKKKTK